MDYRVYKLNKAGSLLNFRITLPIIAVYFVIAAVYGINAYLNSLSGYPVFYVLLGVIFTVHMILFIYDSPADFVVEDGKIIFIDRIENIMPGRRGRFTLCGTKLTRPYMVRVNEVHSIEYSSNFIESSLNIGHIKIRGVIRARNPDGSSCNATFNNDFAAIYGIRDFRKVCRELETAFPYAEHKGIKY